MSLSVYNEIMFILLGYLWIMLISSIFSKPTVHYIRDITIKEYITNMEESMNYIAQTQPLQTSIEDTLESNIIELCKQYDQVTRGNVLHRISIVILKLFMRDLTAYKISKERGEKCQ